MSLRIATRGSPLALWQAREVREALRAAHADLELRIVEVRTEGDRNQTDGIEGLSATGVFTKEVDAVVLRGGADLAVHSLKDQLTTLDPGLHLAMVLPRGPVEDAVVGRVAPTLAALPAGARVATGSLRRAAQILRLRNDLTVVGIRGNVDSRLSKLEAGEADALILARAGLERLGLAERITEVLSIDVSCPAVSQGIVGVTCRVDDARVRTLLAAADHATTHAAALAERAFLRTLHGGCNVPAGAHGTMDAEGILHLRGRVLSRDGARCLEGRRSGAASEAEALGVALADELATRGAGELIRESRDP